MYIMENNTDKNNNIDKEIVNFFKNLEKDIKKFKENKEEKNPNIIDKEWYMNNIPYYYQNL